MALVPFLAPRLSPRARFILKRGVSGKDAAPSGRSFRQRPWLLQCTSARLLWLDEESDLVGV
jgi:hypothetical protein